MRGDLEFQSIDEDHRPADRTILNSLKEPERSNGTSELIGCQDLSNMDLNSDLVAKVLPGGCVHAAFSPRNDTVVLAAADKQGSVGFWKPPLGCAVYLFRTFGRCKDCRLVLKDVK